MAARYGLFVVLVAFLALGAYAQVQPGVKLTVQSQFLNQAAQKIAGTLNAKILDTPIPNQSGSFGIPVIGKIVWSVTNIKFKTLQFSNAQLTTVPGVGLKLYIQNINVDIAMDFQVQLKSIIFGFNEKGSASAKTTDGVADFEVALGELNSRMTASLAVNSFTLSNMRVHLTLSGVPTWILDIITGLIDRPVKRAIQSAVEKDVANAIVKLNSELQAANTLVPLGLLDFNIGLPSAPIFTSSYLSLPVFGDFVVASNPVVSTPAIAGPMPDNSTADTLNVMVNQYFYDSLGWAMFTGSIIDIAVPQNTSMWKDAIPGLYSSYPNDAMTLEVALSSAPNATISAAAGVSNSADLNIDYYINFPNGSNPLVLQLQAATNVTVLLDLTSNGTTVMLTGKLSTLEVSVSVIASTVGRVNVAIINTTLKTILSGIVKPAINKALGNGIPLPFLPSGSKVSGVNVYYFDGYQTLAADITLPGPKTKALIH